MRPSALKVLSLLAVLAAVSFRVWTTSPNDYPFSYAPAGEFLIHGFAAPDAQHLPLASVVGALLVQWGLSARLYAAAAAVLLALLVSAVEGELATGAGAWAAAAAVALLPWNYPQYFLTLLVAVIAGLLVRRCRRDSFLRTAALSAAIGASLFFRSTLAFLPPALALFEVAPRGRAPRRREWLNALILLLVPFLFLAPWARANWKAYGRLIPFEDGEAACNVVTGALGVTRTVEGPWRTLMTGGASVPAWAAREVAAHPLRFALACLARLGLAVVWCSPLVFFAAWALWRNRRRREFQALGLLCAYLLGILCLMSIERGYFEPLLPLLAVLSFSLLRAPPDREALLSPRASSRVLAGALLSALFLYAYAIGRLDAPPLDAPGLDRALARAPADAWLRTQRGLELLSAGDARGAVADLAAASALRPDDFRTAALLAEASLFAGDPARALRALPLPPQPTPADRLEARLIRTAALARASPAEAREELRAAWSRWTGDYLVRGPRDGRAQEVLASFAAAGPDDFAAAIDDFLRTWPPADRLAVAAPLVELLPRAPLARLVQAEALADLGRKASAKSALARASAPPLDGERAGRIARDYARLGEDALALRNLDALSDPQKFVVALALQDARRYRAALAVLRGLLEKTPDDPERLNARAICEYSLGARADAVASLRRALRADPPFLPACLTLGSIYTDQKRYSEALELYRSALARTSGSPSPLRRKLAETYEWLRSDK